MKRPAALASLVAVAVAVATASYGFDEARRMPLVRTAHLGLADWPAGAVPVRAVLISDIHFGNAAMDVRRLTAIVARIGAFDPDLVLIAGDLIDGADPREAARVGPALARELARLHPRLGTVAVLGNHDLWTGQDAVRATLARAGVVVLQNEAVRRGPLAIGGVADRFTRQDDAAGTLARLNGMRGARLILTHSPQLAVEMTPEMANAPSLILAGHTHCGQVVLPLVGPVDPVARLRYRCGLYRTGGRTIIVTGGLGTSLVPLRLGAPPDLWLLTLGPPPNAKRPAASRRDDGP